MELKILLEVVTFYSLPSIFIGNAKDKNDRNQCVKRNT